MRTGENVFCILATGFMVGVVDIAGEMLYIYTRATHMLAGMIMSL